jgi:hypothetical protein
MNRQKIITWMAGLVIVGIVSMIFWRSAANMPALPRPRQSALHEIVEAYINYSTGNGTPRKLEVNPYDTAHAAAFILARDCQLNDASLWFIQSDEALKGKDLPKTVMLGEPPATKINPAFAGLTLSYEFAANLDPNAPITTPVMWERGLQADGTWSPDSPWKGQGGHIAFLDGSVMWFNKLSLAPNGYHLVKYGTTTPTVNIREALPPGAVVLSAEPKK